MHPNTLPSALTAGESVRYFSSNLKCWISATVESIRPDGTANLSNRRVDTLRGVRLHLDQAILSGRHSPDASETSSSAEWETQSEASEGFAQSEDSQLQENQFSASVSTKSRYSSGGLPIKSLSPMASSRYSSPGCPIKSLAITQ